MHSNTYGPTKYTVYSTKTETYHKDMVNAFFVRPFLESIRGIGDEVMLKFFILLSSIPVIFAFDLFTTPAAWWKGLVYLVVIDWLSGIINAVYRGRFDWNVAVSKWYQVVAYTMVCGASAILSNSFSGIFYYFQYLVYATFFLKEFVSILKTFRLLALFRVMHEYWLKGNPDKIDDATGFFEQVEEDFLENTNQKEK